MKTANPYLHKRGDKGRLLQTHGMSKSPLFRVWYAMLERCENPKDKHFTYYGGRGITVSVEWHTFSNWYQDMGERPHGGTLERIDNNLGYSKENCRWASRTSQQRNMRSNRLFERDGKKMCFAEWEIELKLKPSTISKRVHKGWSVDRAVSPYMK